MYRYQPDLGTPGTEVLDLLFDDQEGVLSSEVELSHKIMPDQSIFTLGDLDADDLMKLLEQPLTVETQQVLLDQNLLPREARDHELDHKYCRSPVRSDSGLSSDDQVYSPPILDTGSGESPYSTSCVSPNFSEMSPLSLQNTSPLPMVEDLNVMEFNFETLDPSSLLQDSDFLTDLTNSNIGLSENDAMINFDDLDLDFQHETDDNKSDLVDMDIMTVSGSVNDTLPFTLQDTNITPQSTKYPDLRLSDEEKTLLAREGISLPENMPLTKEEERMLKSVRRKIRNKVSAKDSRKRKQDYIEGLERRVKMCDINNMQLHKKVKVLEKQNVSLSHHLKKLQAMITATTTKTAQTGTCVMVLMISFALLIVPNLNPFMRTGQTDLEDIPTPGKSRRLMEENPIIHHQADSLFDDKLDHSENLIKDDRNKHIMDAAAMESDRMTGYSEKVSDEQENDEKLEDEMKDEENNYENEQTPIQPVKAPERVVAHSPMRDL